MRTTYFNNINIICSNSVTSFSLSVNSIYLYVNNCNFTGGTSSNILYLGCSYIYINQTKFNFSTSINNIYLTAGTMSGQIDTYFNKITSDNNIEIRLFSTINNLTIKNSKINVLQSPQFGNTINGIVNITNNEFGNINPNITNNGKLINISNNTGLDVSSGIIMQRYISNATINNNIGNSISFDLGPDSSDVSNNIFNNRIYFYGNANNNTITSNKVGLDILFYVFSGSNSNNILTGNKAREIYVQGGTNMLAVGNIASLSGAIHANSIGNIP